MVTATVLHQAGRSLTAQAEIRDASGTLGCMATATFRVARSKRQAQNPKVDKRHNYVIMRLSK